jgi:hypothetical protein
MQRDDIAVFGRDFSHSERADLFPEVPIANMGPSRQWGVRDLDAVGSAAAGRTLTLNQGLGTDFFANHRRREKENQGRMASLPWLRKRAF